MRQYLPNRRADWATGTAAERTTPYPSQSHGNPLCYVMMIATSRLLVGRCGMNQRVTARIVGEKEIHHRRIPGILQCFKNPQRPSESSWHFLRSFIAAGYELKIHPRATPPWVRFDRGKSTVYGAGPYRIAVPAAARTEAHAEALQSMASQLNELSSLIAQTQSLYAQAEEASRKGLNIMLRGLSCHHGNPRFSP